MCFFIERKKEKKWVTGFYQKISFFSAGERSTEEEVKNKCPVSNRTKVSLRH